MVSLNRSRAQLRRSVSPSIPRAGFANLNSISRCYSNHRSHSDSHTSLMPSTPTLDSLVPPFRFALLAAGPSEPHCPLYRGSLPRPLNTPFLSQLNLKTIISLTPKSIQHYEDNGDLPSSRRGRPTPDSALGQGTELEGESVVEWISRTGIRVVTIKVGKAKDGAIPFGTEQAKQALEVR